MSPGSANERVRGRAGGRLTLVFVIDLSASSHLDDLSPLIYAATCNTQPNTAGLKSLMFSFLTSLKVTWQHFSLLLMSDLSFLPCDVAPCQSLC